MPLANFFDKISLSASQRLKGYDRSLFEQRLLSNCIGIVYGANCLETSEGRAALDLAVRILSRLYPNMTFSDLTIDARDEDYLGQLKEVATKINPDIDISEGQSPSINLVIGDVPDFVSDQPCIYIGSRNWLAYYSATTPRSCHNTDNPFGAGSAVCLATANVFRYIFREELGNIPMDKDFCCSAFSQSLVQEEDEGPQLPASIPVSFTLVGTGAIGNAVLWSLLSLTEVSGSITLIDDQAVDLSNLQRYILMLQDHRNHSKVSVIKDLFKKHRNLSCEPLQQKWQIAVNALDKEKTKLVATAVDTTKERLEIQSILPEVILNAWTSPEGIGVSRHLDFTRELCLGCLYLPLSKHKSDSEKIAESLGNPSLEPFIREYLANKLPVDDRFIAVISQHTNIDAQLLSTFRQQRVEIFYSKVICGGRVIPGRTDGQVAYDMEVPLAQESVLAGLLLGAEIVIQSLQLRKIRIEPLTKINMMQPIHNYLLEEETKHHSGFCICQDPIFLDRYKGKWLING